MKDEITQHTFIPDVPVILKRKFDSINRFIGTFYDSKREVVTAPVKTSGNVKGSKAEFSTAVIENLVVRNQFTNLYQNSTTGDLDFVNTYNEDVASTRSYDPSTLEFSDYDYIDVTKPYYKLDNNTSYAFQTDTKGQEFQVIFETDVSLPESSYTLLLDPSTNSNQRTELVIDDASIAEKTWLKLICVDVDSSWGSTWTVKQYGGEYNLNNV
ncbi:MAG: hypothetical protein ACOCZ5_00910 [bacterium]